MAIIRAYTTIEQSRKLAEILPTESADMYWSFGNIKFMDNDYDSNVVQHIPAWSLTALLGVASTYCSRLEITLRADKKYNVLAVKGDFVFRSYDKYSEGFDNLVDACYEMILKLLN